MSTVTSLFEQAQLAEAAYANFLDPLKTNLQALKDEGFSTAQAATFVSKWRVVDQYTASGGLLGAGSGFSENIQTGEYQFSLRGTEPGVTDLSADIGDIVADGLALDQNALGGRHGMEWRRHPTALLAATSGDDHLIGYGSNDIINGGEGNEELWQLWNTRKTRRWQHGDKRTHTSSNDENWRIAHENKPSVGEADYKIRISVDARGEHERVRGLIRIGRR